MVDLKPGITACVAAHPARLQNGLLQAALASICSQTLQPRAVVVANDIDRQGAPWSRQACLDMVQTEWMAWLDSDDLWLPEHLEKLHRVAVETNSVFVFSWFNAPHDPLGHFGRPFDPAHPHHTTITFLVKTELAKEVGFGATMGDGNFANEDWLHIVSLCNIAVERGLKMTHLAERTWNWRMGAHNSSGLPTRGDAR